MSEESKSAAAADASASECVGQATLDFLAAAEGCGGLLKSSRVNPATLRTEVCSEDGDKVAEREARIRDAFSAAFAREPDAAMRALFYARDVRGGLGERRLFRLILRDLASGCPGVVRKNLPLVAEYGRWDDLLALLDTPCEADMAAEIRRQLDADLRAIGKGGTVSLLAKWLPSINASSPQTRERAKRLCGLLGMSQKAYRRALSALRGRIGLMENRLRTGDLDFVYEDMPSAALHKYRGALQRRDAHRYRQFLWDTRLAQARIPFGPLAPYEIVNTCLKSAYAPLSPAQCERLGAAWRSLPDFTEDAGQGMVVLVDYTGAVVYRVEPDVTTRGRVYEGAVGVSLAIYFAERMKGYFHNRVLAQMSTGDIQFLEIGRQGIAESVDRYRSLQWFFDYSASLREIYSLLLTTALRQGLPQEELPDRLYVISDSFLPLPDLSREHAAAAAEAKARFAEHGYRAPRLIVWDFKARANGEESENVTRITGDRPQEYLRAISGLCERDAYLRAVLSGERYKPVSGSGA